jgi:hypothetical protein
MFSAIGDRETANVKRINFQGSQLFSASLLSRIIPAFAFRSGTGTLLPVTTGNGFHYHII